MSTSYKLLKFRSMVLFKLIADIPSATIDYDFLFVARSNLEWRNIVME